MLPTVSVVIPTYKSAPWVKATLESVLNQTFPRTNLELLVVDDASPDDSVAVVNSVLDGVAVNSRVIAREKNAGVAATRNFGWQAATGDWIQFLDADDLLAPHKIELQARLAAESPDSVAVIYSNWQHLLLQGDSWAPSGPINAPRVDEDPTLRILESFAFGYVGPTLIRKTFLTRVGGFRERPNLAEDMDLMLRIAMAGGGFREAHSTKAAFLYRQSPSSLWRAYVKNVPAMRNMLQTYHDAEDFLRQQSPGGKVTERARLALAWRYTRAADFFLEQDPESFHLIMRWLRGLGLRRPPYLSRGMRAASKFLGYENALRLRSGYHRISKRER